MKKNMLLLIIILLILTGCENKEEQVKSEYIAMKNQLMNAKNYSENLPLDIVTSIDRKNEEGYEYKITLKNALENMHNIKVMAIHNYFNDDVFPTIGIFDETHELLVSSSDEINLKGTIQTDKDLSELNFELKLWITYENDEGIRKELNYHS